jgi:hypothetical protein
LVAAWYKQSVSTALKHKARGMPGLMFLIISFLLHTVIALEIAFQHLLICCECKFIRQKSGKDQAITAALSGCPIRA